MTDVTNIDLGRRELLVNSNHHVIDVFPEHFREQYPKLITLFEKYYENEDHDDSPVRLIHSLFANRDITQADASVLQYIEDELLLGQSFFKGFSNKRAAAKYSNTLYRSKGSLYSIQQFFRTFFGIDPEVIYTKKNMFIVGESLIGAESQAFIQDDKLYQTFALLIKADIPINIWRDAYKLFVHPAGMYIGSEVQIISNETLDCSNQLNVIPAVNNDFAVEGNFIIEPILNTDLTGIITKDDGNDLRIRLDGTVGSYKDNIIGDVDHVYNSIEEWIGTNSPTFDADDSDGPTLDDDIYITLDQTEYSDYS